MQISTQQVDAIKSTLSRPRSEARPAARSVDELAAAYGVKQDEVRRFTEMAMAAEDEPLRARRVRELARRIQDGSYLIDADEVVEMAERRAIADRSAEV